MGLGIQSYTPSAWFTHVMLMHMHSMLCMTHVSVIAFASYVQLAHAFHFACFDTHLHWLFMRLYSLYSCMFVHLSLCFVIACVHAYYVLLALLCMSS